MPSAVDVSTDSEPVESSYEPGRKKKVNMTGGHKKHVPSGVAVREDLKAEISARRYAGGSGGGGAKGGPTVERTKDAVIVKGTTGNDSIRVEPRKDGKAGVDVTVNGKRVSLSDEEAKKLVVDAGAGNDRVVVDPRVTYDLTLKGGSGDDLVRAGGGNDTVHGGSGRDVLYGGEGDDKVFGQRGGDVAHGGGGKDTVAGGEGDDLLYGGGGDDTLAGGAGKNVLAGGEGANTYAHGGGKDRVFHGAGDKFGREKGAAQGGTVKKTELAAQGSKPAGHTISIQGSAEFKAKVEAELEALRSTPTGRALLEDIDRHPDKPVVIKEGAKSQSLPNDENDAMPKGKKLEHGNGTTYVGTGKGTGSTVTFNADQHRVGGLERSTDETDEADPFTMPPALVLFHELVHSHRSQVGESEGLQKLEEFETTGTEHHHDPDQRYDWKYTENKLREELGLPDRPHYDG